MKEFIIYLSSVSNVEQFVAMATTKDYIIHVSDGQHTVAGKSFMEMFCLVLTRPLIVTAECSEEALMQLREEAAAFAHVE